MDIFLGPNHVHHNLLDDENAPECSHEKRDPWTGLVTRIKYDVSRFFIENDALTKKRVGYYYRIY